MKLTRPFELKSFGSLDAGELFLGGWAGGSLLAVAISLPMPGPGRAFVALSSPAADRRHPFVSTLQLPGPLISLGTDWRMELDLRAPVQTGATALGLDPGAVVISDDAEFLRVAGEEHDDWTASSLDLRSFVLGPHPERRHGGHFVSIHGWHIRLADRLGRSDDKPYFSFDRRGQR